MVLFFASIVLFNFVAYKMRKQLTKNQIVHIWKFTMILEIIFDIFIDEKTNGYWYFWKGIDWTNILVYTVLIPPVNVIFLNWFPFYHSWLKKIRYFVFWVIFLLAYELLVLQQPLGYFHYGWWKFIYSALLDPILLLILLVYYKWICRIEISKEDNSS
ncbi:hypothetical protein [Neobacillus cucumis]|uniref:hypothetical protein n=1 Tax=Neobacillus cucumis TaxID=1740721 RepID=UPI00285362CA|nr:hypothetical protein [Neobacillus cucumis]MDR4947895.1 hypothetical protein [Neobacillus cucumis]